MEKYRIEKVGDRSVIIGEMVGEKSMFGTMLVVGDRRAALIDSGIGISGDLDRQVRRYTQLPVIVVHTHSDIDHVGSDALFDEIYLSPLDAEEYSVQSTHAERMKDIAVMVRDDPAWLKNAEEHMVGDASGRFSPLSDGQVIDLGGIHLEVIAVPGHSKGSVCFRNREENYIHLGDAICPVPWIWFTRCPSVETYLQNVREFQGRVDGTETLYCSHSMEALPKNIAERIEHACEEILSGQTKQDQPFEIELTMDVAGKDIRGHVFPDGLLVYDSHHLRERGK